MIVAGLTMAGIFAARAGQPVVVPPMDFYFGNRPHATQPYVMDFGRYDSEARCQDTDISIRMRLNCDRLEAERNRFDHRQACASRSNRDKKSRAICEMGRN
ncbi:hypothetical protein ACFSM5_03545 [Lacibacterium aquatile]|uniref:Uncharacterized protein n=1 Tax=Lacibacterium aquatile TaxID=1168082 RepID=A0ABW5DLE2_9PROT